MAYTTPKVQNDILEYSLPDGIRRKIVVDSSDWCKWLEQHNSFHFKDGKGSFSAHKRHKYWYAYRRNRGKLHAAYIGKDKNVTLERLNDISQKLAQSIQANIGELPVERLLEQTLTPCLSSDPWPLLITKLRPPSICPHHVPRQNLVQYLNDESARKLILISAPPGSGKTMLLREWVSQCSCDVAWLSLDKKDNSLKHFLSYFLATLATLSADQGNQTTTLLQTSHFPLSDTTMIILINEMAAITHRCILVLDNYHTIYAKCIHNAVSFLLEYLPSQFHIVIATRNIPPLPLTRLRSIDAMIELNREDLRFTSQETTFFLIQTRQLSISAQEAAIIENYTQGWIVGLHFIASALQKRQHKIDSINMATFLQNIITSEHYLLDYLAREVLSFLPKKMSKFLLETSLLSKLTGDLCNAITGDDDGVIMIDEILRMGLFISPCDQHRRWFRYHKLFADLLKTYVYQVQADTIPGLHMRASYWYENHKMSTEAIDHALAAKDYVRVAALIEYIGQSIIMKGKVTTVIGWFTQLPVTLISSRPRLYLIYLWTLLAMARFEAVNAHISKVEQLLANTHEPCNEHLLHQIAVIRSTVAMNLGDVSLVSETPCYLSEQFKEQEVFLAGITEMNLGDFYLFSGNSEAALQAYNRAFMANKAVDNKIAQIIILCSIGELEALRGRLHQAANLYTQAIDLAAQSDEHGHSYIQPAAGKAYIFLGAILYEWNQLDAAFRHITKGIRLCKKWGHQKHTVEGYQLLVCVKQAQGDWDAAMEICKKSESLLASANDVIMLDRPCIKNLKLEKAAEQMALLRAWLNILSGNFNEAMRWMQKLNDTTEEISIFPPLNYTMRTLLWLHQGLPDQASQWLEIQLQIAVRKKWDRHIVDILTLTAICMQAQGNLDGAVTTLAKALSIAESEGYIRTFIEKGAAIASLLYSVLSRKITPEYTHELLVHMKKVREIQTGEKDILSQYGEVRPEDREVLTPQLSPRELEVLQLLAQGLSNCQIAQELVLAHGTVKKHLENIYRKLCVNNRTLAILRAREVCLL